ncbi:probable glutamine amidotransferase Dug3p [[Candida] railenensis]|uniref:Probable glutamine amidotransferase Dug3p n=1 Tax=[Candida] railenensis TaxID=45579 RepID=A0A9P0QU51_9ASCO|nr:probable glutamine amidotransferase Dug3p [[Candida] railenensis]
MCRFMIYKGHDPMVLSDLLTKPAHSIINQSFDSRLRLDMRNPINGDGFGVGYYTPNNQPCIFKAITPAWNNVNLNNLSHATESKLVFGHVRASTQGVLSETNCHPFSYGKIMFMHNGGISAFNSIKKRLINHLDDEYFLFIQGSTDSECCFALFLDTLHKMGYDPADTNLKICHNVLRKAVLTTIELIKNWQTAVTDEPSLMNFAVTDGSSVVITRYITSKKDEAASLHFSTGSKFFEYEPGLFKMERLNRSQDVIFVASEPLTFERGDWICVPTNTTITLSKNNTVLMHPILDEFYDGGVVERSSGLAMSKGLMGGVPKKNTTTDKAANLSAVNSVKPELANVKPQPASSARETSAIADEVDSSLDVLPPLQREGRKLSHSVY